MKNKMNNMYVSMNGRLHKENELRVHYSTEAFQYGYGVFETIKMSRGKLHFLQEHFLRMMDGCAILKLAFPWTFDAIKVYCHELMDANGIEDGALKIICSKNKETSDLLITTRNNMYRQEDYERGFGLTFGVEKRNPYSPLVYIKSNNYIENLLARGRALEKGYDEVIFTNVEGYLCEGAISNLFFVKDNKVYTPAIACGLLPGIIRDQVIKLCKERNIPMEEGYYKKEDLLQADEIFITNSLLEVMRVSKIEEQIMAMKTNGIIGKIIEELERHTYPYP